MEISTCNSLWCYVRDGVAFSNSVAREFGQRGCGLGTAASMDISKALTAHNLRHRPHSARNPDGFRTSGSLESLL